MGKILKRKGKKIKNEDLGLPTFPDEKQCLFKGFKIPSPFPIKDLDTLENYRGFTEILEDLAKLNLIKTKKKLLEYCNSLFWHISLLQNNKDQYFFGLDLQTDFIEKKIKEKYGDIYFTHFLKLIRIYELTDWEKASEYKNSSLELIRDPNEVSLTTMEGEPVELYSGYYYFILATYFKEILSGVKKGILIYPLQHFDIAEYFADIVEPFRTKFFIECFNYLNRTHQGEYPPFDFLNLVNDFLSFAFENGIYEPLGFLEAILRARENTNELQRVVESHSLLYCILLGIKYNIGRNENIEYGNLNLKKIPYKAPDKIKLEFLYNVLIGKAKTLGCSPDLDPLVTILEHRPDPVIPVIEEKNNTQPNVINKIPKMVWALVYYYKQLGRHVPQAESHPKGKMEAIFEEAKKVGITYEVIISKDSFYNVYKEIEKNMTLRVTHNKGKNLRMALDFLKGYPEAINEAIKEIETIKKKGHPLFNS